MSLNVMRAATHQQEEDNSVDGPASYPSGGFSVRTDLGRVDEVIVHAGESGDGQKPFDATAVVQDNNALVVSAFSQPTGVEAAAGTDLSNITFSYTAQRL